MTVRKVAGRFLRAEAGASVTEYAILLMLIAVLTIGAMVAIGGGVGNVFDKANEHVTIDETPGPGGPGDGGTFALDVTIDGGTIAFKALGPDQTALLSWNIQNGAFPEEERELGGSCVARGNVGEEPGDGGFGSDELPASGALSGSETLAWSEDYVGCTYKACFAAGDPNDEDVFEEKCATLAFVGFTPDPNPTLSMRVNGNGFASVPVDGSAAFAWTNTMTFDAEVSMSLSGSTCASLVPGGFATEGTYTADYADYAGCTVTMCAIGRATPDESVTYKCAKAFMAAGDNIPDLVNFQTTSGLAPNSVASSNIVTITGINRPTTLATALGAQASVNGAAPVSGGFVVNNGDEVALTATSSASAGSAKQVMILKSGWSARWILLNTGADEDPTMGNFVAVSNQYPLNKVSSNRVLPSTGSYAAMNFTVDNGTASIYVGGTLRQGGVSSGVVVSGEQISLSTTSGVAAGEAKTVTLHFGSGLAQTRTWTVTNKNPFNDTTPDPISIATDTQASSETLVVSMPVVASGFDTVIPFGFPGQVCVNGNCSTNQVSPGDSIVLKVPAPTSCEAQSWTFGTVSGSWYACPVAPADEELLALGYCSPESFEENYGDHMTGWGAPGEWYWHNDVDEFSEGDGSSYSNQTFAYECTGGSWQQHSGGFCSVSGSNQSSPPYAQRKANCASDRSPMPGYGYACSALGGDVWSCYLEAASN